MAIPTTAPRIRAGAALSSRPEAGRTIGGEFSLDLSSLEFSPDGNDLLSRALPVFCGRTALRLILQSVSRTESKCALLPSYLCKSIIQPFREEAYEVFFYQINEDLSINLASLEDAFHEYRPGVLLFINYFGFPTSEMERQAVQAVSKECIAIEDCVQGSLIESKQPPVGKTGHFSITSFRKYLPLPDGDPRKPAAAGAPAA